MVSGFKYYSKQGMGLAMSAEELIKVNSFRVGKFYDDMTPMLPLLESPGLRIIDPTKAGDGVGLTINPPPRARLVTATVN